MRSYKCLKNQTLQSGEFSIVPIRDEDKYLIMQWRNEQMYHLRQSKLLTKEDQEYYFSNIIDKLFEEERPNQLLFSYLENGFCIGYGGLVHINWIDRNAEISFVINPELEQLNFELHWTTYLGLIEKVAFNSTGLHKIYTYAFDLRPHLYPVLLSNGFVEEARLKEHVFFEGKYKDVLIHSKINNAVELHIRQVTGEDALLLFNWANCPDVRKNAINQQSINWDSHLTWFNAKLNNPGSRIFILKTDDDLIGQIRFDLDENFWTIDYSIDEKWRGNGFGKKIVSLGMQQFTNSRFKAVIRKENIASIKTFIACGFKKEIFDDHFFELYTLTQNG
jgi:RimJ/RimL family protein N-acetyltransferase